MTAQRRDIQQIEEAMQAAERLANGVTFFGKYLSELKENLAAYNQSVNTPFSEWLRQNPRLSSTACGLSINDVDWVVHQYRSLEDKNGPRTVNNLMLVEEKRWGKESTFAQQDTLSILNQALSMAHRSKVQTAKGDIVLLRYYGLHVLRFSHSGPSDSETIKWGDRVITVEMLEQLIRFELSPKTFRPYDGRRHHRNKGAESPLFFVS